LNCVGFIINQPQTLCTPSYTALLPQYGLFQMLSMSLTSDLVFFTDPAAFTEVLISSIEGGKCSGDKCSFPYARKLYSENVGYEVLGAVILILIGVFIAHIFAFPSTWVLYVKGLFVHCMESMQSRRGKQTDKNANMDEREELEEVTQERALVDSMIHPLLAAHEHGTENEDVPVIADHSKINREELPPILMHKLRKVYPSFGRTPPKVALNSLDLHVPKGQVLGFLGKNGAGTLKSDKRSRSQICRF
jgi:hypothetical protein